MEQSDTSNLEIVKAKAKITERMIAEASLLAMKGLISRKDSLFVRQMKEDWDKGWRTFREEYVERLLKICEREAA
jgi:hypothetical protein